MREELSDTEEKGEVIRMLTFRRAVLLQRLVSNRIRCQTVIEVRCRCPKVFDEMGGKNKE